jgi:acyl carrier protein
MSKHRERQVIALVAGELNREPNSVRTDQNFIRDLHADSIDTANILDSVRITFGVHITLDEARAIDTISDLISTIESKKEPSD